MSRRPFGPADDDAPDGEDALTRRDEPTLRDRVIEALLRAGFRAMRHWPIDRGAFLNEVSVSPVWLDRGWEVCSVAWHGTSKGSAAPSAPPTTTPPTARTPSPAATSPPSATA